MKSGWREVRERVWLLGTITMGLDLGRSAVAGWMMLGVKTRGMSAFDKNGGQLQKRRNYHDMLFVIKRDGCYNVGWIFTVYSFFVLFKLGVLANSKTKYRNWHTGHASALLSWAVTLRFGYGVWLGRLICINTRRCMRSALAKKLSSSTFYTSCIVICYNMSISNYVFGRVSLREWKLSKIC